jgi:transcription antitermination factor NusG
VPLKRVEKRVEKRVDEHVEKRVEKRTVKKADGRYLIYYEKKTPGARRAPS